MSAVPAIRLSTIDCRVKLGLWSLIVFAESCVRPRRYQEHTAEYRFFALFAPSLMHDWCWLWVDRPALFEDMFLYWLMSLTGCRWCLVVAAVSNRLSREIVPSHLRKIVSGFPCRGPSCKSSAVLNGCHVGWWFLPTTKKKNCHDDWSMDVVAIRPPAW